MSANYLMSLFKKKKLVNQVRLDLLLRELFTNCTINNNNKMDKNNPSPSKNFAKFVDQFENFNKFKN